MEGCRGVRVSITWLHYHRNYAPEEESSAASRWSSWYLPRIQYVYAPSGGVRAERVPRRSCARHEIDAPVWMAGRARDEGVTLRARSCTQNEHSSGMLETRSRADVVGTASTAFDGAAATRNKTSMVAGRPRRRRDLVDGATVQKPPGAPPTSPLTT